MGQKRASGLSIRGETISFVIREKGFGGFVRGPERRGVDRNNPATMGHEGKGRCVFEGKKRTEKLAVGETKGVEKQ